MKTERDNLLNKAINEALASEEIIRGLDEAALSEVALRTILRERGEKLWAAAADEATATNAAMQEFIRVETNYRAPLRKYLSENSTAKRGVTLGTHEDRPGPRVLEEWMELRQRTLDALREKGVIPEARTIINEKLGSRFSLDLPNIETAGLSQVYDPGYELETSAKTVLWNLLNTLGGGAIGIAGPRGAGKTTLLLSLGKNPRPTSGKPFLPIVTSAPVHYETREFILHLFESLCNSILKSHSQSQEPNFASALNVFSPPDDRQRARKLSSAVRRTAAIFFLLGYIYVMLGSWGAYQSFRAAREKTRASPSTSGAQRPTPPSTTAKPAVLGPNANRSQTSSDSATAAPKSIIQIIGWKPSDLLSSGILWMVLGMVASQAAAILLPMQETKPLKTRASDEQKPEAKVAEELVRTAVEWQHKIRFQQSYSSGWSGALKFPAGLEFSANGAFTLSQLQMTVPAIVDAFRAVLELAARSFKVVVAVDELDKIESHVKAQEFVNELKVLFGVPGTFFLISVSENAMAAFALRGMPVRDAFDSAFDAMIYVDNLGFQDTRKLLDRRLIGLPVPFAAVCYAFSGGLPRDVIRTCRSIFESADHYQMTSISELFRVVLLEDVISKARATRLLSGGARNPKFAGDLQHLIEITSSSHNEVWPAIHNLATQFSPEESPLRTTSRVDDGSENQLDGSWDEFLVYLCYVDRLAQSIDVVADTGWNRDAQNAFEALARAKRALSTDPVYAYSVTRAVELPLVSIADVSREVK